MALVQCIWTKANPKFHDNPMPKITIHADCGDAPEKELLRDLNIAFAKADVDGILDFFTDDIRWQIMGEADLRGKAAVREALDAMKDVVTRELVIHSIFTEGREGAVNGLIVTEAGGAVVFCDICRFASDAGGLIESMKSFAIEVTSEE